MKYLPIVAGALLGLLFIASGMVVLLEVVKMPPIPEGTPESHFMAAFAPTGYLKFVKVLEIVGGILVALPRTRNLGLLVLGPIVVNILAYHVFVKHGEGLLSPPLLIVAALPLYLLWVERKAFAGLIHRNAAPTAPTAS